MRVFAILLVALAAPFSLHAQQAKLDLDKIVPLTKQRALGLERLTPEQKAGVASLLIESYRAGLLKGAQENEIIESSASIGGGVIESHVDGESNGWEGETIVKLANGQIWQQTEFYYQYRYAYAPKVIVYRGGGGYKMKVEGIDKAIGVERVR